MRRFTLLPVGLAAATLVAQTPQQPDWPALEKETLQHFQALVQLNTTDPPGGERPAAEYLKQVLEREGISARLFALDDHRPNLVARLKGNGKKRPLLIMGHTDTVNVDEKKWTFPPFSAACDGGYLYGRGTVDDKDNVTGALVTLLTLKRLQVPLDCRRGRGRAGTEKQRCVNREPALMFPVVRTGEADGRLLVFADKRQA